MATVTKLAESDSGREIRLAPNEQAEVWLAENRTTGFKWEVSSNGGPVCALIGDAFQPGGELPGAAGTHCWRFRAATPGSAVIELSYRRPWDKKSAPARAFSLRVTVSAEQRQS